MGGRSAEAGLSDGPQGGGPGDEDIKWGQPNTPQEVMRGNIRGTIGSKGEPISAKEAIRTINPYRDIEYGDYSMNCQRCVVAFELNRRGYNVEAEAAYGDQDPMPKNGNWAKAFPGAKFEDVGGRTTAAVNKNIIDKAKEWGNGSRAIVRVKYPHSNTGHVFNVEYHNGKLLYYDAQTNTRYDPAKVFDHVSRSEVQVVRVDNLPIGDQVRQMVRKKRSSR